MNDAPATDEIPAWEAAERAWDAYEASQADPATRDTWGPEWAEWHVAGALSYPQASLLRLLEGLPGRDDRKIS